MNKSSNHVAGSVPIIFDLCSRLADAYHLDETLFAILHVQVQSLFYIRKKEKKIDEYDNPEIKYALRLLYLIASTKRFPTTNHSAIGPIHNSFMDPMHFVSIFRSPGMELTGTHAFARATGSYVSITKANLLKFGPLGTLILLSVVVPYFHEKYTSWLKMQLKKVEKSLIQNARSTNDRPMSDEERQQQINKKKEAGYRRQMQVLDICKRITNLAEIFSYFSFLYAGSKKNPKNSNYQACSVPSTLALRLSGFHCASGDGLTTEVTYVHDKISAERKNFKMHLDKKYMNFRYLQSRILYETIIRSTTTVLPFLFSTISCLFSRDQTCSRLLINEEFKQWVGKVEEPPSSSSTMTLDQLFASPDVVFEYIQSIYNDIKWKCTALSTNLLTAIQTSFLKLLGLKKKPLEMQSTFYPASDFPKEVLSNMKCSVCGACPVTIPYKSVPCHHIYCYICLHSIQSSYALVNAKRLSFKHFACTTCNKIVCATIRLSPPSLKSM